MMKNISEIKHNIRTVEETRQITNAMFLLSTSRMKRAMLQIGHNQRYMQQIRWVMKDILVRSPGLQHAYVRHPDAAGVPAFLVIASDKGLCGSYNSAVMRLAAERIGAVSSPHVCAVGQHATDYLKMRNIQPDVEFTGAAQRPDVYYARAIGEHFINWFDQGQISSLSVIYTHYSSQLLQEPRCLRLLPVLDEDFDDVSLQDSAQTELMFSPSVQDVMNHMIPQYVVGLIYDCLNQAVCSEQVSRMNAMQNATKNADDMLYRLNLDFNTARQLAITNEITEIAAATEIANRAI